MPFENEESVILRFTLKLIKMKVPVVYLYKRSAGSINEVFINLLDVILILEKLMNMFSDDEEAILS
jgi:hypothetical protein